MKEDVTEWHIETIVTIHPAHWIQVAGFAYGMRLLFSKSFRGLDCKLKTYRAVPDDAKIFQACRLGDVSAIKELFKERSASPWDTDSKGVTPLLVSCCQY
jgi:hypothetical protein